MGGHDGATEQRFELMSQREQQVMKWEKVTKAQHKHRRVWEKPSAARARGPGDWNGMLASLGVPTGTPLAPSRRDRHDAVTYLRRLQ